MRGEWEAGHRPVRLFLSRSRGRKPRSSPKFDRFGVGRTFSGTGQGWAIGGIFDSVRGKSQESSVKVWSNPRWGREGSFGVIYSLFEKLYENHVHTTVVNSVPLI